MESLLTAKSLTRNLNALEKWLLDNVLVLSTLVQALVIVATFVGARFASRTALHWVKAQIKARGQKQRLQDFTNALSPVFKYVLWLASLWIYIWIAAFAGWPHRLVMIVSSLLTAWVIIRLTSTLMTNQTWARVVSITAWSIAALLILGLMDPTLALLDSVAVRFGGLRISALTVVKGFLSLVVLLWAATMASRLFERRITGSENLTPSMQVLFAKLLKIVLITVAVLAGLSSVGIDITAFAVFSGAIGVGIGFGLQKVVSNLISGVILLLDKSIKPGDVIVVGETYGWIISLGARYVSVVTRDGTEHLIPNEDLITQRVENWSFSHKRVRLKIPIGISYESDVHEAIGLCEAAANATPRVLDEPAVQCLLRGFGDSSVDLELRIWIDDPPEGLSNVKSDVLLRVWDSFHENDIKIPFPQRDLHIRSPDELAIVSRPADKRAAKGAKPGNAGGKPGNDRKPQPRG